MLMLSRKDGRDRPQAASLIWISFRMKTVVLRVSYLCLLASVACDTRRAIPASTDTTEARSDRWLLLADLDTIDIQLDSRTVLRRDTNDYRVWLRWTYSRPQPAAAVTDFRPYWLVMQRTDIDCVSLRLRLTDVRYYDSTSNVGQ